MGERLFSLLLIYFYVRLSYVYCLMDIIVSIRLPEKLTSWGWFSEWSSLEKRRTKVLVGE